MDLADHHVYVTSNRWGTFFPSETCVLEAFQKSGKHNFQVQYIEAADHKEETVYTVEKHENH